MSEVKWIKIVTDIFDNRKIKQIEQMPDSDALLVIWFKLICLAGKVNDNGFLAFTDEVPYTDRLLANEFNKPIATVQLALKTFQEFQMIEVIDDIIRISNWEKYQNVDGMERIREQTRVRVARHRENKKLECNVTSNATVTQCNALDIEEDIDKEIDKNNISCSEPNELASEPVAYIPLNDGSEYGVTETMYNEFCSCYPSVDVKQELLKMRAWSLSNPTKKKTKRGVTKFINGWLSKEQDKGGTRKSSEGQINLEDWANEKE